jgi:2-amino-4-hydroxy-6-hydroxymethyldihydropteridine diphosphokinase
MAKVYISLGSNMGDRLDNLRDALQKLHNTAGIKVINISQVYETEPVGYEDQDWFYNAVALLEVELSPLELLKLMMATEQELGRKRLIHWGPRTIDLDILLYDDLVINQKDLIIPHPRMAERAFVMVPLSEIAPEVEVPGEGKAMVITNNLPDSKKISCISLRIW